MRNHDPMTLLKQAVAQSGQSAVARSLGYSAAVVNQVIHGKYRGRIENVLSRVSEVYGTGTVDCPVMGKITLRRCAAERKKPFAATSPQRVRLYQACKSCTAHR